ncbi:hypothetical protein Pse7367_2433 [Thalassoporum mexicanum PCC 7367]|uniref:hypothetical protein n=1 Tax=Thalassoporum mexicanum TaxID=3457544 RepID=UPI00029FD3A0|nr:hypothetical protein [Pseudanabaena sp. PCC 7367]AFY70694.1 hypothetical protein Pse7367_2433 [Pseudanabaena sp. PCC 7367]
MKMHDVDKTRVSFARKAEYNDRGDYNAVGEIAKIHREMCNRYTGSEAFGCQSRCKTR